MTDISESKFATWAVRGLGGAVNILDDLADEGHTIDQGNLLDLGRAIRVLVVIYNTHAAKSSLEPHERPPIAIQPVRPADAPEAAAADASDAGPV